MSFGADLLSVLSSSAARAAGNVSVEVKTNLGPPLTFSNLTAPGPSALDLLGVQYSVTVLDAQGRVLVKTADPPATNVLLATAYVTVFAGALFVFYRGFRSFFN